MLDTPVRSLPRNEENDLGRQVWFSGLQAFQAREKHYCDALEKALV